VTCGGEWEGKVTCGGEQGERVNEKGQFNF
jgi:hypothetical protein